MHWGPWAVLGGVVDASGVPVGELGRIMCEPRQKTSISRRTCHALTLPAHFAEIVNLV